MLCWISSLSEGCLVCSGFWLLGLGPVIRYTKAGQLLTKTAIPFCLREFPGDGKVATVIGVGRYLYSMYPSSVHSNRELNSSSVKYTSELIIHFSMSLTSYWSAPSKISCMISGTRVPSHTWKIVSSLRMESRLTPYSFESSPETSPFTNVQCCVWVALSLSWNCASWNCVMCTQAYTIVGILLYMIY